MINTKDIIADMLPIFLDDAREKLERLSVLLGELAASGADAPDRLEFMRLVHSLKGTAGSFGFPSLALICHRLEDYVLGVNHVSPRVVQDISAFIEAMVPIVEAGADPSESRTLAIYQALPHPPHFDQVASRPLAALFIGPRNVQWRMIEAAVRACGIRLSSVAGSFQGIEIAVRTRPDFVMLGNVVDVLDGTEIAWMLRSARRLKSVPILLLVSDAGVPQAHRQSEGGFPAGVTVVRKYPHFPDDFADALTRLNIL